MDTSGVTDADTGTSYEDLRAANIRRNEAIMHALGNNQDCHRFELYLQTALRF